MKAIIYKPARNVMQSALGNDKKWILSFSKNIGSVQESLMGYASSLDNTNQVRVVFTNREDAIEFAKENNIGYEIRDNNSRRREKKSYTFNFTKDINLYYY